GSLLGNSSGLGAAVNVTLDHAFFRADAGLTFGSITTLASTDSTLEVSGTSTTQGVFNFMTSDASFDGEGLTVNVRPENVRVQYEVGGADLGATFAGFHDNFSIDRLNGAHPLVPSWTNAGVTLVDSVNNSGGIGDE